MYLLEVVAIVFDPAENFTDPVIIRSPLTITLLALTYPEADMLLEVVLVKMAIGLVTDVTPLIVLALTYPEALMLLEEMAVKMPSGLVTDVTP